MANYMALRPDREGISEHGVKKRYHAEFDQAEAYAMVARLRPIAVRLGVKPLEAEAA